MHEWSASMFKSLLNLFKRPAGNKTVSEKGVSADEIRKYAKTAFITPVRQRGEKRVTFSAMDLQRGMTQHADYPHICGAIDAKKFTEFARVELIRRDGAKQGASAKWTFKVL